MEDIKLAIKILKQENVNFVIVKDGNVIIKDDKNGIRPALYAYLKKEQIPIGSSVADKLIGRAAAILLSDLKIKNAFAYVMSTDAEKILKEKNIEIEYDEKVEKILNRDETDFCPMEKLSKGENDAYIVSQKILHFLGEKHEN